MLEELVSQYGVRTCVAVLKARNYRSLALLAHLGFTAGSAAQEGLYGAEPDECVMIKRSGATPDAA